MWSPDEFMSSSSFLSDRNPLMNLMLGICEISCGSSWVPNESCLQTRVSCGHSGCSFQVSMRERVPFHGDLPATCMNLV